MQSPETTSPHFCCQDNKSCSALSARELRIPELFPSTSSLQNSAVDVSATGEELHPAATPRPALCPQPPALRGTRANRRRGPRCDVHRVVRATMSMSWIFMLLVTLPPASRYTRAAADSTANPRLPRIPATAHAAQWWPLESGGWPHRQTRLDKDRGSHKRRSAKHLCVKRSMPREWATRERDSGEWSALGAQHGPGTVW